MKISKNHTCIHCKHIFKWEYQFIQKMDSNIQAEFIREDIVYLNDGCNFENISGFRIPKTPYLRCPKCEGINSIEISLKDLNI